MPEPTEIQSAILDVLDLNITRLHEQLESFSKGQISFPIRGRVTDEVTAEIIHRLRDTVEDMSHVRVKWAKDWGLVPSGGYSLKRPPRA